MNEAGQRTELAPHGGADVDMESLGVFVWEADAETFDVLYISPHAYKPNGTSLAEWKQPGFWARHVHPDDIGDVLAVFGAIARDGKRRTCQFRLIRSDGRPLWVWAVVSRRMTRAGPRLVAFSTELGSTLTAGRATPLLSAVLGSAPVILCVLDPDGTVAYVDGEPLAKLRLRAEQLIGHNIAEVFQSVPWVVKEYERAHRGESFVGGGSFGGRIFETHVRSRVDSEGRALGAVIVALDVTERQHAEENVRRSNDQLSVILANMGEAIAAFDSEGRVVFVNEVAAKQLAVNTSGDARKLTAYDISQGVDAFDERGQFVPKHDYPIPVALRGGVSEARIFKWRAWNGIERWTLTRARPVKDPRGVVTLVVAVWWDVTQQKQMELRLEAEVAVQRILAYGSTLEAMLPKLLPDVRAALQWDAAAFWGEGAEWPAGAGFDEASGIGADVLKAKVKEGAEELKAIVQSADDVRWYDELGFAGYQTCCAVAVRDGLRVGTLALFSRAKIARQEEFEGALKDVARLLGAFIRRRRAERALDYHRSLIDSVTEATLDGILVVDANGKVLSFNHNFERLWEIPEEILRSRNDHAALEFVNGKLKDPEGFRDRVRWLYQHPTERAHDLLELKDGRTFERYSAPVKDPSGSPLGRVWFFRDVTEKRRDEARSRALALEQSARRAAQAAESRARYLADVSRLLAGSFHDRSLMLQVARLSAGRVCDWCVVDLFNTAGVLERVGVVHASAARSALAADVQEHAADITLNTPLAEAVRSRRTQRVQGITDETLSRDLLSYSPFGTPRVSAEQVAQLGASSFIAVPIVSAQGVLGLMTFVRVGTNPLGTVEISVAEDVARRLALAIENARLFQLTQAAVQARDEFLSIASHELRTPITSIQLALQAMERSYAPGTKGTPPPRSLLDAARRQTMRLGKLVSDLLDVSRIRAGRLMLELAEVDAAEVVRSVTMQFSQDAASCGSKLEVKLEEDIVGLFDRSRLEQVVANLLSNALKYGAGKPVTVKLVRDRPGYALLTVSDQGIGVPYERQAQIFDPFERAVSSRNYGGLGLGLFIVRKIVTAMGGRIWVTSQPGRGSTFSVELPATQGEEGFREEEGANE